MMRSLLFLPGNSPSMLINADVLGADALIFDLEDAVSSDEKDSARLLVRNALRSFKGRHVQAIVRINAIDESGLWQKDIQAVLPEAPDFLMPTKVNSRNMVQSIAEEIGDAPTGIIPLIETALGIERAMEILDHEKVFGVLLGAEDLTADLRSARTKKGDEILYARSRIVMAARALGIEPFDTPFADVNDDDGLIEDAKTARMLGFSGKAAISPRHVTGINRAFSPTAEEIAYAREVLLTIQEAKSQGKGAVSLRGKMIDAPIVHRAKQVIAAAEALEKGASR